MTRDYSRIDNQGRTEFIVIWSDLFELSPRCLWLIRRLWSCNKDNILFSFFIKVLVYYFCMKSFFLWSVTLVRDFQRKPNFQEMSVLICFMSWGMWMHNVWMIWFLIFKKTVFCDFTAGTKIFQVKKQVMT